MENLWGLIAEKRGLKIGEEFEYILGNRCYKSKIEDTTFLYSYDDKHWFTESFNTLTSFIVGEGTIKKLPPKFAEPIRCENGKSYKHVDAIGNISSAWFCDNCDADLYRRKAGNMFALDAEIPQEQIDKIIREMKE